MTITCATCGRDSGVRAAALGEGGPEPFDPPELEGWACAVPQIGEPFRFYCPACWPAARPEAAQP
jgi:hypothetical protein